MTAPAIHNVLIARGAFHDIYEPAWVRALGEVGVQAELFETHDLTLPGILGRVERRLLRGPGIRRIQKELVAKVRRERPEVILLYQGHYFDIETVEELARHSFVVGYHNDDPFGSRSGMLRYRLLRPALPLYNGFHVYRDCNAPEARACGVPNVGVLQSYYLPWLDFPRELYEAEKKRWGCDLVFAGHAEKDERSACLSAALRQGIDVRIYGEGQYWKRILPAEVYSRLHPIERASGADYRRALCGAKIAACFFSKWNRDQYTRRVFEIPACGVFLLCERSEVMAELYREGEEIECFSTPEEFVDKAAYYLAHDDERRAIAAAGHRRATTSGYDIHSRMRQWLADVAQWRGAA